MWLSELRMKVLASAESRGRRSAIHGEKVVLAEPEESAPTVECVAAVGVARKESAVAIELDRVDRSMQVVAKSREVVGRPRDIAPLKVELGSVADVRGQA